LALIRQATRLLAARARYELAEHRDLEAAFRDIKASLSLSDGVIDDGNVMHYLVGIACRSLALQETCCWPEEFSLNAEESERLARLLDEHPFDARSASRLAMQGEAQGSQAMLDAMYARTPDGDGFLVLAGSKPDELRPWVLGALNLMSPLFESRRTAEQLMVLSDERVGQLSELPASELVNWDDPGQDSYRPVVGPLWQALGWPVGAVEKWSARTLVLGIRVQVESNLSATVIALHRYRIDNGQYPKSLSLLVPNYSPKAPVDLFDGQPLRYRPDESGEYLLYSVAEDMQDDGGREFGPVDSPYDWVAKRQREDPVFEWFLVAEEDSGGSPGEHAAD
jgi:hypothetical protein